MGEFGISYKLRAAIKARVLADFAAKLTKPDVEASNDQAIMRSSTGRIWLITVNGSLFGRQNDSMIRRCLARIVLSSNKARKDWLEDNPPYLHKQNIEDERLIEVT